MVNVDATCRAECNDDGIVEISIVAAEHVGLTALGGLHHIKVVGIAQRGVVWVTKYHHLAYLLQELRVVVEFVIGQRIKLLQARIPKYSDGFDDDFIREKQRMAALKHRAQHFSSGGTTSRVGANQDGRVKNYSQMIGL
jgi:hypothetical protein